MIVIPMAGMSSRFTRAGFDLPKYQLQAHGRSLFAYSVMSFSAYFQTEPFLFVYRDVAGTADFIRRECERMGLAQATFVELDRTTGGQAETVMMGLNEADIEDERPITIFNIDTFRPGFAFPDQKVSDHAESGYLEVFEGPGEGWSFVRPDPAKPGLAAETAEKRRISSLCCTGLYHFARAGDFRAAYRDPPAAVGEAEAKERYVAPLYNSLIREGRAVGYVEIDADRVIFCGVPEEYAAFLEAPDLAARILAGG